MYKEALFTVASQTLTPKLNRLSGTTNVILGELYGYLKDGGTFYDDPRTYLLSHDPEGVSKVLPLTEFEGMGGSPGRFPLTVDILHGLFGDRFVSAHISSLSPGTDFKAHSDAKSKTMRAYVPLVLPHPLNSSGVWIEGKGVRHHFFGLWRMHALSTRHSMFNYTSAETYVLVIDLKIVSPKEAKESLVDNSPPPEFFGVAVESSPPILPIGEQDDEDMYCAELPLLPEDRFW
jgi:hypothetical protein